jgi:hypothetical protein
MAFEVHSPSFADGDRIPDIHTKEHGNVSPVLDCWNSRDRERRLYGLVFTASWAAKARS